MESLNETIGMLAVKLIQDRIRKNQITPESNNYLDDKKRATLVQSGRLMKSIAYSVENDQIKVGSQLVYAKIHHEGGEIVPQKAKWLTIPLTKKARARRATSFKDTFIHIYPEGYGYIFQNDPNDPNKIIPLYELRKKVTIPARPYLFLDYEDEKKLADVALDHMILTLENFDWRKNGLQKSN